MSDAIPENPAPKPKTKPKYIWIDEYALHEDEKFQQLMRDYEKHHGQEHLSDVQLKRRKIRDSDD